MKKLMPIFAIVMLTGGAVACKPEKDEATNVEVSTTATETAAPAESPVADPTLTDTAVTTDTASVTATETTVTTETAVQPPAADASAPQQ